MIPAINANIRTIDQKSISHPPNSPSGPVLLPSPSACAVAAFPVVQALAPSCFLDKQNISA
jgi:hypothetical protein